MRIGIDVDCTTGDFVGAVCKLANDQDRNNATRYNWFETNYSETTKDLIAKELQTAAWWNTLPVIKDANKGIAWLRGQGHELVWITVPFRECRGWLDARREWLERNFQISRHKEPLITVSNGAKYLVSSLDVLIDDVPEIIDAFEAHNPESVGLLFGSELNRQFNRERVSWEDVMSMRFFWHGKYLGKPLERRKNVSM